MIAPTTTLLAYIPSPPQGVWHLGPIPLRAYALCIIVGIILAVWWGDRRWVARGGQPGEVLDVAIWAVPFGLIGGRIYHVLTDWRIYFGDGGKTPIEALYVWDGGLGIWGAVILGGVGAWIGCRRMGIRLPAFADAIGPPILAAQAIGRLGNYFNQELYGRPTTVPWGLEIYDRTDGIRTDPSLINGVSTGQVYEVVQPTFLYEMLWNLLVVAVLVFLDRRFRIGHGRLFALYVAGYCAGRFVVELLRSDTAYTHIAGIRINVFTAALLFVCAAVYFVVATKGREQGLTMYRPERAEELEALGARGYVDDADDYDDYDVDGDADGAGDDAAGDDLRGDDPDGDDPVADQTVAPEAVATETVAAETVAPETVTTETVTTETVTTETGVAEAAAADPIDDETPGAATDTPASSVDDAAPDDEVETVAQAGESPEPEVSQEASMSVDGTDEAADDAAVDPGEEHTADGVDEDEAFVVDSQSDDSGGDDPITDDDPGLDADIIPGTDEVADAKAWTPDDEPDAKD